MSVESENHADSRKDDRRSVVWSGTLTRENDQEYPCSILDVAFAGTLIESPAPVDSGEDIILSIEGLGDFAATVKWSKGDSKGLVLMAGPNLLLKEFSEASGSQISKEPKKITD